MFVDELTIRRALVSDRAGIIEVCKASLGWQDGDPNEEFFAWKHDENSFGQSPMWVAEDPVDGLVGVRAFMRWRFRDAGGEAIEAVRAVDTATLPSAQGRGIFRRLTLGAIPDLRSDGIDVVFNTPNDKSRPGYLKMGWNDVGRVPVAARVRNSASLPRLRGAKTAAAMWSQPTTFAESAADLFADESVGTALLGGSRRSARIATDRDARYLRWRYSFAPLHYRVLPLADDIGRGAVVFRVRQRGTATEVAVCDILGPPGLRAAAALGAVLRGTGADYLVVAWTPSVLRHLCLPAPRLGPRLTWRSVARAGTPAMSDLRLSVGDVELF